MNRTAKPHWIDRTVDALIDREHPFWQDERQAAVYNEAASAALVLQATLIPIVGGIGLLIAGKPAVGLVTAIMVAAGVSQWLVLGVLLRRRVNIDLSEWRKGMSTRRKVVSAAVGLFYAACFAWVQFRTFDLPKDRDTVVGMVVGAASAIIALVIVGRMSKRNLAKHLKDTE